MADSSSQQPSLTVVGGPLVGQRLVLDDAVANLLIGSDPSCDLYLPHDTVSPIHARLWMDLDGAVLHETSSPHGLYVNDVRVAGKHPLHNGDIVWLGPPGGADVVMIQCTLAGNDEANTAPAPPDDTAERDALESLAPTLAARPSLADFDDAPGTGPEAEPPPIPRSRPAARKPEAVDPHVDDSSRTVAFKLPADFAAALASPRAQAPVPPAPTPSDDIDALFTEHEPPPMDVTVAVPPAYVPEAPPAAPAEGEPYLAEPEPYLVEPEPYVAAPAEPEPAPVEPDQTQVMFAEPEPPPAPGPVPAAGADADFDDMIFAVPDEPPAAPPEPDTVLLAPPPRPQPPAPPTPPPRAPEPPKTPPAAAAPAPVAPRAPQATAPAPPRPVAPKPPAPRPAAPAAARPARPAARVERAPAEAIEMPAPSRRLPVAALAGAGVLVVILAAAAGAFWYLNRAEPAESASVIPPPPSIEATPAVTPMTTVEAQPIPDPAPTAEALSTVAPGEDVVTIVRTATPPPRAVASAAPTAAATPRPVATRRPDPVDPAAAARARAAAQVAGLLAQAHTSASARNYDAAAALYDEALRLDPQNTAALAGKAAAASARAHARRAFVTGRTAVQTEKARGGGLAGFDSSDVKVQKAPDFQGRVEFAMTPSSVQPGDPWTLKVYVVNEGKKAIKISALSVAVVVNGSRSGTGGPPKNREIAPQQRVIVDELSGAWPVGVTSWSTEVKVTAGKNDTLQSQLTWK
jgi:hypothetical protein